MMDQEKDGHEGAKADVVGGASGPLAEVDPFADLLELSFPKSASNTAGAPRAKPAASASPMQAPSAQGEVAPVMTGSLAAKKRKSQESRHKRDDFLNQMTNFLEGIESKTRADVIPPEPPVSLARAETYTSTAFPPAATESVSGKQVLWANAVQDRRASSGAASASSSLMQEDLLEDPFLRKALPSESTKAHGGLRAAMIGAEKTVSHPRGSLFDDDDVGLEDTGPEEEEDEGQSGRQGSVLTSDPVDSPLQRMTSSPLPFSAPTHDVRASLAQGRSRSKSKPSRGLDLEEVRRRTSLLSGGSRAPPPSVPALARPAAASPRPPPAASSYFDGGWGPQQPAAPSGEVPPHPLHAPADPLFTGGNYFNEDLLRARGERSSRTGLDEGHTSGRGVGRGGWASGDALKDSAGIFLNTARDGAKTLLQDAKAGVDAVGASWQSSRDENGQQRVAGRPPRGSRQEVEGEREFEVTFGEGRFGFTLFREDVGSRRGQGVVCKVHTGSTAHSLGVSEGDAVTGVNKQRYETYDDVMAVLPKLPRPVLITFSRGGTKHSAEGRSVAARRASTTSEDVQGGGNPLEWLAKLNPFDKGRRDEEDELRGEPSGKSQVDSKVLASREFTQHGSTGEVFARGVRGGVFSWSYYGTSDGIESNTRDAYTEHVMRCQWGKSVHTMHEMSWMVARRYREFDALDLDLRDAYPDRKDALPRLPPKEFFKMAPDVVERRAKGLELYMTTLIRRFPDMLASSHLDRFLTISERLSTLQTPTAVGSSSPRLSYRNLGANGSSSNVFPAHSPESRSSSLVGTDYILNLMSSEEAWRLSQARRSSPVDVAFAEDLVHELEDHISRIPPDAHLLSDEKLYGLVARCQKAWPGLKSAAAAASGASSPTLLPRIVECDEGMECAFEKLRALLTSRGYIG
ncbi:unnamed protein product [Ectocarpus sp. CCAP 1310/34]|nr:unnamed protein product [Ectocarpus sp. CCAP 1310/34]